MKIIKFESLKMTKCSIHCKCNELNFLFPHCKTLCMFPCIPPVNGCSRPGASCHVMWWMTNYDLTIHFNQEKWIKRQIKKHTHCRVKSWISSTVNGPHLFRMGWSRIMVVQWLVLLPYSKKVVGSIPGPRRGDCTFSLCLRGSPTVQNVHVRPIKKNCTGVHVIVNVWPRGVQGVTKREAPANPWVGVSGFWKWMNGVGFEPATLWSVDHYCTVFIQIIWVRVRTEAFEDGPAGTLET